MCPFWGQGENNLDILRSTDEFIKSYTCFIQQQYGKSMHSSRMRTTCLLTISGQGVCPTPGVCIQGGVCPAQGGLHPWRGVCPSWGVCIQGDLPNPGGSSQPGGSASRGVWADPLPLWTEWHTGVKTLPCPKLRKDADYFGSRIATAKGNQRIWTFFSRHRIDLKPPNSTTNLTQTHRKIYTFNRSKNSLIGGMLLRPFWLL